MQKLMVLEEMVEANKDSVVVMETAQVKETVVEGMGEVNKDSVVVVETAQVKETVVEGMGEMVVVYRHTKDNLHKSISRCHRHISMDYVEHYSWDSKKTQLYQDFHEIRRSSNNTAMFGL
jgi:NAD(P)H-nitrite reductase large subunit